MRLGSLQSAAGFLGRPPFRGASGREVNSSRACTKSSLPSGRPVCVECRNSRVAHPCVLCKGGIPECEHYKILFLIFPQLKLTFQ